jgi:hypothetical protein
MCITRVILISVLLAEILLNLKHLRPEAFLGKVFPNCLLSMLLILHIRVRKRTLSTRSPVNSEDEDVEYV